MRFQKTLLETSGVVGGSTYLFLSNQLDSGVNNPFDISKPLSSLISSHLVRTLHTSFSEDFSTCASGRVNVQEEVGGQ